MAAIRAHMHGLDPYHLHDMEISGAPGGAYLRYTSTPIVDQLFRLIARQNLYGFFWTGMLLAHFASMIAIPTVLSLTFWSRRPEAVLLSIGVFMSMFDAAGVTTLAAANNGTVLYGLIVVGAYLGLKRGRWTVLHASLVLATAVKPFYAAFWILPVFAEGFSRRQLITSAVGAVLGVCPYVYFLLFQPHLFSEWSSSLLGQTLHMNDVGDNVFGSLFAICRSVGALWAPYAAQAVYAAALFATAAIGRWAGPRRWAVLFVLAVFVNPRIMPYDEAIASVPLLAVAMGLAPSRLSPETRLTILAPTFVAVTLALTYHRVGLGVLPYRLDPLVPASIVFPAIVLVVLGGSAMVERRARRDPRWSVDDVGPGVSPFRPTAPEAS